MGRNGKHEVQTCSRDDSCQSNPSQKIDTSKSPSICGRKETWAVPSSRTIWTFSSALEIDVRLMNRINCGVSKTLSLKKCISNLLS